MAQRFAWQSLAKGFEVLTKHRADAEADVLLHEALVVEDLRDHRLTLGIGEQQLDAASAAASNAIDAGLRSNKLPLPGHDVCRFRLSGIEK